jgi:hypothetical protein
MRWHREAVAEGRVEGRAELLHEQLETKFGRLPKWAEERVTKATLAQLERWGRKVITAGSLEGVLGKR